MNPTMTSNSLSSSRAMPRGDLATLSQAERAHAISSLILEANIVYGVWRMTVIAFAACNVSSRPAMIETLAGIPVVKEAHAGFVDGRL